MVWDISYFKRSTGPQNPYENVTNYILYTAFPSWWKCKLRFVDSTTDGYSKLIEIELQSTVFNSFSMYCTHTSFALITGDCNCEVYLKDTESVRIYTGSSCFLFFCAKSYLLILFIEEKLSISNCHWDLLPFLINIQYIRRHRYYCYCLHHWYVCNPLNILIFPLLLYTNEWTFFAFSWCSWYCYNGFNSCTLWSEKKGSIFISGPERNWFKFCQTIICVMTM